MALVTLGFGKDHPQFDTFYKELLLHYYENIANETTLFPGMAELLSQLEKDNIKWGVVTNKPAWLTEPLMDALDLTTRAITIVSGDTLEQRKPHPAPLLHACKMTGSHAEECLYVGDAERDIEAGNRAGMHSVVALFGYIADSDNPESWGADATVNSPQAIIPIIESLT
jgi:phosphoglycolate phosphatase